MKISLENAEFDDLSASLDLLAKVVREPQVLTDHIVKVQKERDGLLRAQARLMRKTEAAGRNTVDLLAKLHTLRHELARLEELLMWIYRKDPDIKEIRVTLDERIPRAVAREREKGRIE